MENKKEMKRNILGSMLVLLVLTLFNIGSPAEKLIIILLGLIYWKLPEEKAVKR